MTTELDDQEILDRFSRITVWKRGGERAPHKPLRIYEHRCAVCGYDGQLDNIDLALDAARIRWHAADGADAEDNGVGLCTFHHRALDRGAIGLDDDRRILVSQHVRGSQRVDD